MAVGRPRAFDMNEALDKAMEVFWEKGYEGASMPDLTAAMGINRPSIYAAFGNKESLFRKALDRYMEKSTACFQDILNEPTAYQVAARLLHGTVEKATTRGCMMVQGALSCSKQGEPIKQELIARRTLTQKLLSERFARAKAEGDLPAGENPEDLARYVSTILQGISIQATSGTPVDALHAIVDIALRAWPK